MINLYSIPCTLQDLPVDRSAGEFMTPKFRPEKDPVLQLLARMHAHQPDALSYNPAVIPAPQFTGIAAPQLSGYPQASASRGQVPLRIVEKSLGEISIAQPKIDQGEDVVFADSQAATVRARVQHLPSQGEIVIPSKLL